MFLAKIDRKSFAAALRTVLTLGCVSAASAAEILEIHPSVGHEIDEDERGRVDLFPEASGFVRAFVTREPDGSLTLNVTQRVGDLWTFADRPLSAEEWAEMRRAFETGTTANIGSSEGRVRLVAHAIVYGVSVYGAGVNRLLSVTSERETVGVWMLAGGAATAYAFYATSDYDKGIGYAKMMTNASYIGLYLGHVPGRWRDPSISSHRRLGRMVGLTGALVGAHLLFRDMPIREADADLTFWGMTMGAAAGLAVPYLAGVEDLSGENVEIRRRRTYLASVAAGVPLGGYAGWRLARDKNLSDGQASMLRIGSAMGAFYGLTTALLIDRNSQDGTEKSVVWGATIGAPLGVAGMYHLTKNEDYSKIRAALIGLGTVAGGLIGSGVVYVASNTDNERAYLVASSAASAAAFQLVRRATR